MSGPGGTVTNRDRRRATRQEQFQQRQDERRRQRQREIRRQQLTRWSLWGGGGLLAIILIIAVSMMVINSGGSTKNSGHTLNTSPATGQTVDGLTCQSQQGGAMHIHQYLELYINGQRVNADPGVGIVQSAGCLYPLHVHDNEANIIHDESGVLQTFTLGQFFDIWGAKLSSTQLGQYTVDGSHKLVVEVFDANGKMTVYSGNPYTLQLQERNTIYLLYNSPNVKPAAWDGWATFNG
ncbi:MAG TPA: hypothetical protein VF808_20305 [Ktedonobacterales bacterium]